LRLCGLDDRLCAAQAVPSGAGKEIPGQLRVEFAGDAEARAAACVSCDLARARREASWSMTNSNAGANSANVPLADQPKRISSAQRSAFFRPGKERFGRSPPLRRSDVCGWLSRSGD